MLTPGRWALRSLTHRKTRTLLTASAIGLASALVTTTLGYQAGFQRSLDRNIEMMGYQLLITGKGCPHEAATLILRGGAIPMYLDERMHALIASDPSVRDTTRFLMQSVPAPERDHYQVWVGIDDAFLQLKPMVELQRGEWFSSPTAAEAIVGFNVAEYRRLELGDSIELLGRTITVRGILDKMGAQDDGMILLPLSYAQQVFERRDQLTGIGVRLRNIDDAEAFMERMYELPAVQVVRMSDVQNAILRVFRGVRALLWSFSGVCIAAALLGVLNVSLISVHERTPEMGVLRALGCSGPRLFQLVWSESLLLALLGTTLGVGLTFIARGALEWLLRTQLPIAPSGDQIVLMPSVIAMSLVIVVALCLLAAVVPAWRATRVSPLSSMRGAES